MADLNTAISPAPVVTCFTKGGAIASGYTGNVTMAMAENPTGAALAGTLTVAAVAGLATFSNLTLNRSGKGFTLRSTGAAQAGQTPRRTTSDKFDIATRLVFTTQPSGGLVDAVLTAFAVTVRDSAGNTDTSYNGVIELTVYSGPNAMLGTSSVTAVSGVATFSDISFDEEGNYSLLASAATVQTAYTPSSVVSAGFSIGLYTLVSTLFFGNMGYEFGVHGSLTPNIFNGVLIASAFSQSLFVRTRIIFEGTLPQNFFTSITANSITLLTASASQFSAGANTSWTWDGVLMFDAETTYEVEFI